MASTLDDLVYHEEIRDFRERLAGGGQHIIEQIIEPMKSLGFVFKTVMFHMLDDRIPFIGIFVLAEPGEESCYVYPCDQKAGLVLVGAIRRITEEKWQVMIADDQSGRYVSAPYQHKKHFGEVYDLLEHTGVEVEYVHGHWV